MRTIDADKLMEEFKRRHRAALRWKEEALINGNEESVIRADATLAFLSEVKLTIDNALTVEKSYQEPKDYIKNKYDYLRPHGKWIIDGHHYKCSRCGKTLAIIFSETDDDLIGCPFCLADMRGGRE